MQQCFRARSGVKVDGVADEASGGGRGGGTCGAGTDGVVCDDGKKRCMSVEKTRLIKF